MLSPLGILREAVKAVPAVRYALGVAGIAAVIAVVAGLKIDLRVAAFGTPIIIGLMYVLLTFSSLAGQRSKRSLRLPALVMAWAFLCLSIMSSTLLATAFFFQWPMDLESYFGKSNNGTATSISITGEVKSVEGTPIFDAVVTIDGNDFSVRSKTDGRFVAPLRGSRIGDIITLRAYHPDYVSFSTDRKIQDSVEYFEIVLGQR